MSICLDGVWLFFFFFFNILLIIFFIFKTYYMAIHGNIQTYIQIQLQMLFNILKAVLMFRHLLACVLQMPELRGRFLFE